MSDNALHLSVAYEHVHGFFTTPKVTNVFEIIDIIIRTGNLPVIVNQVVFALL